MPAHSHACICTHRLPTPAGELTLGAYDGKLCLCDWTDRPTPGIIRKRLQQRLGATFQEELTDTIRCAIRQLEAYFAGELISFSVPLLPVGTEFQRNVWNILEAIPYGQTITYRQLAEAVGNPAAVRAVANANRLNAISIFIPCHRVIGSGGALTGYAGGIAAKEVLLRLEASVCRVGRGTHTSTADCLISSITNTL